MALDVVDLLEPIGVEIRHGDTAARAPRAAKQHFPLLDQTPSIDQTGERARMIQQALTNTISAIDHRRPAVVVVESRAVLERFRDALRADVQVTTKIRSARGRS